MARAQETEPSRSLEQSWARRKLGLGLAALPLLLGLWIARRDSWVCDDAFISFRYVDHWNRGLGLVYNAGERVEGYTHFLWVILLGALHRLGFDLVDLGRFLPLVFHAGTLALLFFWSMHRSRGAHFFLPIAAWGVALHRDMQIWASGGLETAAFTFCVTAAALVASGSTSRPGLAAALAALATLFRPEGFLVSACIVGYIAWRRRDRRDIATFAAVWLALVVPLVLWRFAYYHDWLPNTFYAKSARLANWEQGWHYVSLYLAAYPIALVGLAAAITGGWWGRHRAGDPRLLAAVIGFAILFYVIRVGGDFMFARFLIPITPLLYVAIEETWARSRPRTAWIAAAVVIGSTLLAPPIRARLLSDSQVAQGIADEHRYYPLTGIETRRRQGEELAAICRGTNVRLCILGAQASMAYFGRFPYVFERYGLTDRALARQPVGERGRPGHERGLLRRDMIDRRVHFFIRGKAEDYTGALDEAVLGELLASIVRYDRALMDSIQGRPAVRFVDYPVYLDSLVQHATQMTPAERRNAWAFADGYYFQHNIDPVRYERTRQALFSE